MASAYDRLLSLGEESTGQIEILGDPASLVTEADKNVIEYTQKGYRLADKTYLGIGDGVTVPAATPAGPGIVNLRVAVLTPFKINQCVIPSFRAPGLILISVTIGPTQMIDGHPIPADMLTEVSNALNFSWPTVEMSQEVRMQIGNRNAFEIEYLDIGFKGIRLRK